MAIKRVITIVLIICTALCCTTFVGSAEPLSETFYYEGGVEVTVEYRPGLSYDDLHRIADTLAGVEITPPEGDSIMLHPQCAAGNHALVSTYSYVTEHNVYSTSPKCVKKTYLVETCERMGCFFSTTTLISSLRISTCHG